MSRFGQGDQNDGPVISCFCAENELGGGVARLDSSVQWAGWRGGPACFKAGWPGLIHQFSEMCATASESSEKQCLGWLTRQRTACPQADKKNWHGFG